MVVAEEAVVTEKASIHFEWASTTNKIIRLHIQCAVLTMVVIATARGGEEQQEVRPGSLDIHGKDEQTLQCLCPIPATIHTSLQGLSYVKCQGELHVAH